MKNIFIAVIVFIFAISILQLAGLWSGIAPFFSVLAEKEADKLIVVKASPVPTLASKTMSFKPEKIFIEKVNINLPIVSVPLKNGTWEVSPKVANFAEGTSLVNNKEGNVGIFAHDRKDAFSEIKNLKADDVIIVYGNSLKANYKVVSSSIIDPKTVDVFYPTKTPTLTLVTCNGIFSEKRYIIKAKLVAINKI